MSDAFDKFSYLDPTRMNREFNTVMDNPNILDHWTVLDRRLRMERITAALDNPPFNQWSALDKKLAHDQLNAELD